jgi:hypothetical protein
MILLYNYTKTLNKDYKNIKHLKINNNIPVVKGKQKYAKLSERQIIAHN